jgi:hypothetical protein
MSILELLLKGKEVASQKKWRESFSYCEQKIPRLNASMFKLSLYSALEQGTSISLVAYDGRAESQVVLKVARRGRGTIGVTLDGSFLSSDKSGQGTIQGNFNFTMPRPRASDLLFGRHVKDNDATFFEDGEMRLYTGSEHKGEFREVRRVSHMGLDAYGLMIVLERKPPLDLAKIKPVAEMLDEQIRKKLQEQRGKTLEDILDVHDELPRPKPKTFLSAIIGLEDCLTSGVDSTQVRDRYSSILGMKAVVKPVTSENKPMNANPKSR